MVLPKELYGRLWHTTHPDRFTKIMKDGYIVPNPSIPNNERWKTSEGPDNYPFVRTLNGVSLFDFNNFDEKRYSEKYQSSNWREFVPYRNSWGKAVWIEINRDMIANNFISGEKLFIKWKHTKAYRHTIMPMIEAAYIGSIPSSAFSHVLICNPECSGLQDLQIQN